MSSREENLINQLQNHIKILEHEVEKQKKENENLLNLIRLMQDTHPSSKKFEL
jgi:predicted RNase H-like nuclease (RuvC/YqgF family)